MAKFNVLRDTFISHIGKLVKAGEQVEFEIPEVKVDDKLVPMRIGDNLELIEDKPKVKTKKGEGDELA